jgi:serine/threonine protein kinase
MPCDQRLIDLLERCVTAEEGRSADPTELCASCPELLPDLKRLWRFDDRLKRLLGLIASLETMAAGDSVPDSDFAFPVVPGYTILRELAEGGMGRVYHARDTRLDREVALKVIRPERLSEDLRARFTAEARAVARLDHPNIVQIFEVGEYTPAAGGPTVPFLALEFVPGGTLESRAGTKPMAPAEAARIVCLLARAMTHAHARGIVHRDLKPGNVLIGPHADEAALNVALGRPRITDFGLARRQDRPGMGITSPGTVLGTPAYMAPEQAEGESAGPAADVYALGAILYRLLTGKVVFASDSLVSTLHHICHTPPQPPRELAGNVPAELEALCLRCLAKRASDRPTAAELAAALDRPPVAHGVDAGPIPDAPMGKRRRWRLVAAAAAVLVVALPLALLAWRPWRSPVVPVVAPVVKQPLLPLKGYLDAKMTRPGDGLRQNVAMNDPGSRPMRPGDQVRVHVKLNRPAYVYLVWIDSAGKVMPMYPWIDGDWKKRGPEEKGAEFRLPRVKGEPAHWEMGPGKPGLETIVLLCRDDPLPEDKDLAALLGKFGPVPLEGQDAGAVAWFENGEMVRDEPQRAPLVKPVVEGNPLERLNREVQRRVKGEFSYTRAITYGYLGDRP